MRDLCPDPRLPPAQLRSVTFAESMLGSEDEERVNVFAVSMLSREDRVSSFVVQAKYQSPVKETHARCVCVCGLVGAPLLVLNGTGVSHHRAQGPVGVPRGGRFPWPESCVGRRAGDVCGLVAASF